MRRWSLLALAAGLLLFVALAAAAPAARADDTIVVDTTADPGLGECDEGGECSLREAIELVDKGEVSGDVLIEITAAGRIEIGEEGELFIDPEEEAVDSVKIVGTGPEETIVDGQGEARGFWIAGGDITLASLGVTGGNVTGFTLDGDGGAALFQAAGEVRLEDVHFNDNEIDSAREGGAIAVEAGNLTVVDSVVNGNETNGELNDPNVTDGRGGGIFSESSGSLTLERTEVSYNFAVAGGGVYQSGGTLKIVGGRFESNLAGAGGAIATGGGSSASVEGTLVGGGDAVYDGGGIKVQGSGGFLIVNSILSGNSSQVLGGDAIEVEGPTTIEATTIYGNGGVTGGGNGEVEEIEASAIGVEGPLELRNSTVAENVGIGIDAASGTTTIHGSTIAENEASAGEAGGISGEGAVSMVSSILALNRVAGMPADCDTTIESRGNNLLQTTAGCDWESAAGDIFNADPQLRPLGEYEGPTNTMGPASRESPVINNGSEPLAADQRGFTRPVPTGAVNTDIGAFEVQAPENEEPPFIGPFDEEVEPVVGETLTCSPGTWDTDTVTDALVSYAWFSGGVEVGTGDSYVVANSDAGREIECEETVDNGATSVSAGSEAVEPQSALAHLDPASLDLGSQKVGTGPGPAQTLTLTNEGSADLEVSDISSNDAQFPVDGSACTAAPIAPQASCVIEVSFAPTEPGAQLATLTVESNGGEQTAELTGTGTAPAISVAPGFHDFGQQLVGGTSAPQAFVVTNTGTASLTLGEVELGGEDPGEFELGPADSCSGATLEPGEECTAEVAFAPTSPTGFSATLLFPGEAPTASVGLEGLGVLPAFSSSPTSVDFGSQPVGAGAGTAEAISIVNSGSAPLEIDTVELAGADPGEFAIESDGCSGETLTPDGECTVEVAFAPTATGERSASLVLAGNVPSYSVSLKGTGTEPVFSVAPGSFDFGSELVGSTSLPHNFTVTNAGTTPLFIGQVALAGADAGEFAIGTEDCSGSSLDPGEECSVDVTFKPTSTDDFSARLELSGNAPSASVDLTGAGVAPAFSVSPTAVDFGPRLVGADGPAETVSVTNAGSAPLEIDTVIVTGTNPGDFTIEDEECEDETLAPAEKCTVAVAFAPTTTGARSANLVLAGNAPSSAVPLHGDGSNPPPPDPTPSPGPKPSPAPSPQPPAAPPNTHLRPHSSPYKADAKGKVTLMVTCESASGASCDATLTLLPAKAKGLPKKLGSARATLAPGASRRVAIKLNKKTLAALEDRGTIPTIASVTTANGTSSRTRIVLGAV
jgi:CSLREA domain-containing protein